MKSEILTCVIPLSQTVQTIGWRRLDIDAALFATDRYLIDIHPIVFATCVGVDCLLCAVLTDMSRIMIFTVIWLLFIVYAIQACESIHVQNPKRNCPYNFIILIGQTRCFWDVVEVHSVEKGAYVAMLLKKIWVCPRYCMWLISFLWNLSETLYQERERGSVVRDKFLEFLLLINAKVSLETSWNYFPCKLFSKMFFRLIIPLMWQ